MYFSGLHKTIGELTDKPFYDIALLFLAAKGYRNLSIVDGTGDGGRDVATKDWPELRIQLSVQKLWENKLNDEAKKTFEAGKKHFIYVTNRRIRETEEAEFVQNKYKFKGRVEINIFDLDQVSTLLSLPGNINATYEKLGIPLQTKLTATPQEVAISNTLLFSKEARELKEEAIESRCKAQLFETPGVDSQTLASKVAASLGNAELVQQVARIIRRLQAEDNISKGDTDLTLGGIASAQVAAAKADFLQAKSLDVENLTKDFGITAEQAGSFVSISLEILARQERFDGDEAFATRLAQQISDAGLGRRKKALFEALGKLSTARIAQYGSALNHVFSTNTFDILRALGRSTSITALLDSSVAMPLLFGLTFGKAQSRYSVGASALHAMCKAHQIRLAVPAPYLNEMAHHGKKAAEFADIYNIIGDEPRQVLRASGNAYISHFGSLKYAGEFSDSLEDFLLHFGIKKDADIWKTRNKIASRLAEFDIGVVETPQWTPEIRQRVATCKKQGEAPVIIDDDASVVTFLTADSADGYIFTTWDYAITGLLEEFNRIYADTPSRVVDFLSMAYPAQFDSDQTISLVDSLIHCDERTARALASKIEKIKSAETAYQIQKFTDSARASGASETAVDAVDAFFEMHQEALVPAPAGDAGNGAPC
ncbi:MAG: hypothetical protein JF607_01255 [Burkholderiales bacterium]|nr:hypothetical protein [Burkholderiales bacterium]